MSVSPSPAPPHILTRVLTSERLLFASELVCLGSFQSAPHDPGFGGGEPCSGHTIVFPRRAAWIRHEGGPWLVADPTTVPLYNRGQVYSRAEIDRRGDECEWMAFSSEVLVDAFRDLDLPGQDRPDRPFTAPMIPATGELYAAQRRMFAVAASPGHAAAEIEERALGLLDLLLRHGSGRRRPARAPLEQIEHVRRRIYLEGGTTWSLADLAAAADMSPYRLCREFRRATGMTISAYRTRIRLARALDHLPRAEDLADLALAAGFCSHSHFGAAFRRVFHTTPSRLRDELSGTAARG